MTRASKLKIIVIVVFAIFVGLTEDIDYCRYTAESRLRYRVWGLPLPFAQKHDVGYRAWLENEIGVHFPQEYVDYLNYHPLLGVASTPPGNWLSLRTLKDIYDANQNSHAEVAAFVKEVANRTPPLFHSADCIVYNTLVDKYLSKNDPFGQQPQKER